MNQTTVGETIPRQLHEIWLPKVQASLQEAQSFEELAQIGLNVLRYISEASEGGSIVQICGPISTGGFDNLELNTLYLDCAVLVAERNGLTVFNQMPFQDAMARIMAASHKGDEYCHAILEVFYREIFDAGYLAKTIFVPQWETSTGACWERKLSHELGIVVEDYPWHWLDEVKKIKFARMSVPALLSRLESDIIYDAQGFDGRYNGSRAARELEKRPPLVLREIGQYLKGWLGRFPTDTAPKGLDGDVFVAFVWVMATLRDNNHLRMGPYPAGTKCGEMHMMKWVEYCASVEIPG